MSNRNLDLFIDEIIRNASANNQDVELDTRQVVLRHLIVFCFSLLIIMLYAYSIVTGIGFKEIGKSNKVELSNNIKLNSVAIPDFEQNISSLNILETLNLIIKNEKAFDDFLSKNNSINNNDIAFERFYYQLESCKKRLQKLTYDEMYERNQAPDFDETTSSIFKWLAPHNVEIAHSGNRAYCYEPTSPKTSLILFYYSSKGYVRINYEYLQDKYSAKLGRKWRAFLNENADEQYKFDNYNWSL